MNEKILKYLYDIKLSIADRDSFFDNGEKRFEIYKNSQVIKRAIDAILK
jgi:hypothetical protein